MSREQSDIEELKAMQQEARKRRFATKKKAADAADDAPPTPDAEPDIEPEEPEIGRAEDPGEDPSPDPPHTDRGDRVREVTISLKNAADEVENATREHPTLALLAALTAGIIIGRLVSRR